MDNSWYLELADIRLLIDPWLEGAEVDFAPWFNSQWHRTPPLAYDAIPAYDAVLITQKYPDHCHLQTLEQLQPAAVAAPSAVAKQLRQILPQAELMLFSPHSRSVQIGATTILQLPSKRRLAPFYHAYFIDDGEQRVFIANHGYALSPAQTAHLAQRPVNVLLSPFNRYRLPALLGGNVAPGMAGLARLTKQLRPQHVVQTHDELKHAAGLVSRLARIEPFAAADAEHYPWLNKRYVHCADYTETFL